MAQTTVPSDFELAPDGSVFSKRGYREQITDDTVPEPVRKDAYLEYAGRHNYSKEKDPVFQQTRNESHTCMAFFTSVLAVARGQMGLEDLAEQFTYDLQDGAGEIVNANKLFAGDIYRYSTTQVDLIRKVRHDLVAAGHMYPGLDRVQSFVEDELALDPGDQTGWTDGLGLTPDDGDVLLFGTGTTPTEERPEGLRATARVLEEAGLDVGYLDEPHAAPLEAYESGYEDEFLDAARANVSRIAATDVETVVVADAHSWLLFHRDYDRLFDGLPFEVRFITELVDDLIRAGDIDLTGEVSMRTMYHDASALNELSEQWEPPRAILAAMPGVEDHSEHFIDAWGTESGYGTSNFRALHPDLSAAIGEDRLGAAQDQGVEALVVACPYEQSQFDWVKERNGTAPSIETPHIMELVAEDL